MNDDELYERLQELNNRFGKTVLQAFADDYEPREVHGTMLSIMLVDLRDRGHDEESIRDWLVQAVTSVWQESEVSHDN